MRQIASVLVLAVLLPGCSSVRQAPPEPAAPPPAASRFAFVNDPWINLHHLLYHWALADAPPPPPGQRRSPRVEVAERSQTAALTPEERQAWDAAVSYYQRELSRFSLLFDRNMVDLRSRIARISAHPEELSSLPHAEVFEPAMAVYRRHWWPAHEALNQTWIDQLLPKLETFEPLLAPRLVEAFGGRFPAEKIRVDLCAYSDWTGAYTTGVPPHIVISSKDPDLRDLHALEIVFHEVSHIDPIESPLHAMLEKGFAKHGGKPPENLWHYFIFHTAGALTNEALRSQGLPEIVPYPERTGMYRRIPTWNRYREVLDRSWKEFLAGRMEREAAIDRIAREILTHPMRGS